MRPNMYRELSLYTLSFPVDSEYLIAFKYNNTNNKMAAYKLYYTENLIKKQTKLALAY